MRAIVLPVNALDEAKTRLAPVLSPIERGALTLAMLEDVLDATLAMPGWASWVISPDEAVLEVAARRGARPISEERPTLPGAIRQAEEDAEARGLDALAVVLPDTPLLTPAGLTRALHTLGPVVVGPSTDGTGTNLLLRRGPAAIASRFGTDSFRKHLQAAAEADLPAAVVEGEEIGFDLDVAGRYPHRAPGATAGPSPRGAARDGRGPPARSGRRAAEGGTVQGTIKDFDLTTRQGTLLTDDRAEIGIDADSPAGDSSYRMLRLGQRVRFEVREVDGHPVARSLRLVTFEG